MVELENRRNKLFDLMKENSIAIIFAGTSKIATEDEYYPFVVNNCFYYLTEIQQENSVLLLVKGVGEKKVYLFVDEYNELKEKWTGKRLTYEQASKISGIENVYSSANFENMLNLCLNNQDNQYGSIGAAYIDLTPEIKIGDAKSTQSFAEELSRSHKGLEILDVKPMITALRMVKSEYEVDCLRKAIALTHRGIIYTLNNLRPGKYEYEVADDFEMYGRTLNREGLAFDTIVAYGKNATCLHYPQQTDKVGESGLILFDLGYNYGGYSADISRTFPVNGKFEGVAKLIYETVLNCNKAVIEYLHPGITNKDAQDFTKEFLKNECVRVGLMTDDEDIVKYYYHGVSHSLGLDTHDSQDRNKPYEVGNVVTVEPGLYFAKHGVGVRIEDDVLITGSVNDVLSRDIPKEVEDIEKLFKTRG